MKTAYLNVIYNKNIAKFDLQVIVYRLACNEELEFST